MDINKYDHINSISNMMPNEIDTYFFEKMLGWESELEKDESDECYKAISNEEWIIVRQNVE